MRARSKSSLLLTAGVAISFLASAHAQAPDIDDLNTEPTENSDVIVVNGQSFGWISESVVPEDGATLTELDRLSKSASGSGFAIDVYDPASDNPLIPVSVKLRALDKITARYTDLDVNIGEVSEFGDLTLLPRTCDTRPPEEFPETTAFLEVYTSREEAPENADAETGPEAEANEVASPAVEAAQGEVTEGEAATGPLIPEGKTAVFKGWMFASSPALNALEHPVYDVWVIDCKMVEPSEG